MEGELNIRPICSSYLQAVFGHMETYNPILTLLAEVFVLSHIIFKWLGAIVSSDWFTCFSLS